MPTPRDWHNKANIGPEADIYLVAGPYAFWMQMVQGEEEVMFAPLSGNVPEWDNALNAVDITWEGTYWYNDGEGPKPIQMGTLREILRLMTNTGWKLYNEPPTN